MTERVLFALALLLMTALTANGYEVTEVKNGGSVKGKVKVSGPIPADEKFNVMVDSQFCGDTLPREKYVISQDKGVHWAVVLIEGIEKGKPIAKEEVLIESKKCAFHPHVQIGVIGQTMMVKNSDPVLHNTHMFIEKRTIFNAALPRKGMEIKRPVLKTGLVDVRCDAHSFMHGFMYVVDHPYIAVTDEKGNFSIKDIPPGTYKLKVWHEALEGQEKIIKVIPNSTVESDFELKK